jgi:hypothetical protein
MKILILTLLLISCSHLFKSRVYLSDVDLKEFYDGTPVEESYFIGNSLVRKGKSLTGTCYISRTDVYHIRGMSFLDQDGRTITCSGKKSHCTAHTVNSCFCYADLLSTCIQIIQKNSTLPINLIEG